MPYELSLLTRLSSIAKISFGGGSRSSGATARYLIDNTLTTAGGGNARRRNVYQFGNGANGLPSFMRSTNARLESMIDSSNSSMDQSTGVIRRVTAVQIKQILICGRAIKF